jgi:hypothetical protein
MRPCGQRGSDASSEAGRDDGAWHRHGRSTHLRLDEPGYSQQRDDARDDPRLEHALVRFRRGGHLEVDAAVVVLFRGGGQVQVGKSDFVTMSAGQIV